MLTFKLLPPTIIISPLACFSKKRLFEEIAGCVASQANVRVSPWDILSSLNERERLGSTVVRRNFAMPHCVLRSLEQTLAVLAVLARPVRYNTVDTDTQEINLVYSFFFSADDEPAYWERLLEQLSAVMTDEPLKALYDVRHDVSKLHFDLWCIDTLLHEQHAAEEKRRS